MNLLVVPADCCHLWFCTIAVEGAVEIVIVWLSDLQLSIASVLIITNVIPGAIYTTSYDKSLSVTFSRSVVIAGYSRILHQKKTDYQDITEILLKVALNTITLTPLSGNKNHTKDSHCYEKGIESGVKYHNPNHCCILYTILCDKVCQVSGFLKVL